METERITLSQRERDRLKVLHELQQRHLTQVEASRAAESNRPPGAPDAAPHARTRGCCSGSRITRPTIESQAGSPLRGEGFDSRGSALCRLRAHGWPPNTTAQDGFPVSRETLRTWMTKAAFWHPRCQQRVEKDPRVAGREELVSGSW